MKWEDSLNKDDSESAINKSLKSYTRALKRNQDARVKLVSLLDLYAKVGISKTVSEEMSKKILTVLWFNEIVLNKEELLEKIDDKMSELG